MKIDQCVKPISYLKANAEAIIHDFEKSVQHTLVITKNGEAKAVFMNIKIFEEYQETISVLKLLAQSNNSIQQGRVKPAKNAFEDVKKKIKDTR